MTFGKDLVMTAILLITLGQNVFKTKDRTFDPRTTFVLITDDIPTSKADTNTLSIFLS